MGFTNTTVAGLKLWLKSTAGLTTSGSNVTGWSDQSGNGNDVTAPGTPPTYNASSINGVPGITFAGLVGGLTSTTSSILATSSDRHVIVVSKPTTSGGGSLLAFRLTIPDSTWDVLTIGSIQYFWSDGVLIASTNTPVDYTNTPLATEFTGVTGSPAGVTINASAITLASPGNISPDSGTTGFSVGDRASSAGQGFVGDICEVLVFDHVLSGGDLQQVRAYLQDKYAISLGITALSISPPTPTVATGASQTFTGADGSGAGYVYSIQTNNSGGSINSSTGVYTAGATGSVTDTVRVTDSVGNTADATVTVTAGGTLAITPSTVTMDPGMSQTFVGTGGTGPYTYSISTNNSGGTINSTTGVYVPGVSGGFGTVTDTVRVTDSLSATADATVTVFPLLQIDPTHDGILAGDDTSFISFDGSGTGYVYTVVTNNSGGSLIDHGDGTADYTAGTTTGVTDTIRVTDSIGGTADSTIEVRPPLAITPPTTVTVPVGGTYNFTATGGRRILDWEVVTDGSSGCFISSSGSDGQFGNYSAGVGPGVDTVSCSDFDGNVVFATINVVAVQISPDTVTVPPLGSQLFTASVGTPPYTFALTLNNSGGSLIDNGDGTASYTAGSIPDCTDTVEVTDASSNTADATITIGDGVSTTPASGVTVHCGASQLFTAIGGSGTGYTFVDGGIMSGGSIVDHGNGTATYTAGTAAPNLDAIDVTDDLGNFYELDVEVPGPALSPAGFPTPIAVVPHQTIAFSASGGTGTGFVFSFALNNSGATLNASTGLYTAGATGGVVDVVILTDSASNESAPATIDVGPALAISPTTVTLPPSGTQTFSHTGGGGSITFSIHTNNSGGSINSSTGAYTAGHTGGVTDTIRVSDGFSNTADALVTVTATLTIAPTTWELQAGHTKVFVAAGGSGLGYSFVLTTNNSGGSVNASTGFYTAGSSGAPSTVTDVITLTDSLGNTATATITVHPPIPPTFVLANVALKGMSTIRVTFSHAPQLQSVTDPSDALNPSNYSLSGNGTDYVVSVTDVVGDPNSVDCSLGAPLTNGSWTLTCQNIKDSNGIETI